ncbi:VIT1/CCC1 transporter family protein [Thermosipho atlanticus]|uniref:Predicted Fe2+/Mn2+ transporter, VIT1/CCC1 family n=1 Tax=Thermosipho atlanticus DSM 15807 TaxID=1123380 RepID=A0A1M5R4H2_9BACT|nr:VIT1/CCC1 transporter family protein [Thermosipho atlanticus]SHH21232.1 Predicted Fe2+/Mn2+ transporter, VIT1/CCC1 family [Thermosipho atlanticus DSM 15807]
MFFRRKKSRVDIAREAFKDGNLELHKKAHEEKYIKEEPHKTEQGKYIGSAVYGASDGIVTTFAVVAGVVGAQLDPKIVLILGFANLFADGFSMAIGDYLSEKSERDYIESERQRELWEVEHFPDAERKEIEEIYKRKGIKGEKLNILVDIITSDKNLWVDTMMKEELGLMSDEDTSPLKSAVVTFLSFVIAGFMPLIAYVFASFVPFFVKHSFLSASIITSFTLFLVGALRQFITDVKWYLGGLEMLLVGGLSATVAFLIGYVLRTIFGIVV